MYTGSSGLETTYYLGSLTERVTTAANTAYRYYIYVMGRIVAIRTRIGSSNTDYYVLSDPQNGVSRLDTSSGTEYVSISFTPYGNWRKASAWAGPEKASDLTALSAVTRRGYTGQTMLGTMGLIHMNGRVEDAVTGRFLSADPNIPDTMNTQSYNRFSYVNNNPLSYTDPTGFFSLSDLLNPFSDDNPLNPFGHVGRAVAFAPFAPLEFGRRTGDNLLRHNTWLQPIAEVAACYFGGPWGCAGAQAYLTRLNGGSVEQALIAGALTYVSYEATDYVNQARWNTTETILAKGVIGGTTSSLMGGSFKSGFLLSSGFASADAAYEHYTRHAPGWGPGEDRPGTYAPQGGPDSNWYFPASDYSVPEEFWDVNTFGYNQLLKGDGSWTDCFTQSGACSRFFDKIPGLQATSQLHDFFQNLSMSHGINWLNFPSMLPAAAISYAALLSQYYVPPTFVSQGH